MVFINRKALESFHQLPVATARSCCTHRRVFAKGTMSDPKAKLWLEEVVEERERKLQGAQQQYRQQQQQQQQGQQQHDHEQQQDSAAEAAEAEDNTSREL